MAAGLVHSDFGARENSLSLFPLFHFYLGEGDRACSGGVPGPGPLEPEASPGCVHSLITSCLPYLIFIPFFSVDSIMVTQRPSQLGKPRRHIISCDPTAPPRGRHCDDTHPDDGGKEVAARPLPLPTRAEMCSGPQAGEAGKIPSSHTFTQRHRLGSDNDLCGLS